MSRLIDSEATEKEMLFWADTYGYGGLTKDNIREIMRDTKKTPTVDAVEVIHCEKCKWRHTDGMPIGDKHLCDKFCDYVKPDFYCAYAERRQDG